MMMRFIVSASIALGAASFDLGSPQSTGAPVEPTVEAVPASTVAPKAGARAKPSGTSESSAKSTSIDRLLASYAFVGGERERKGVADAIEDVVSDMNIFVRRIARDRLTSSNTVPSGVRIQRDGRRIAVTVGERTYAAQLDGPPAKVTNSRGNELRMTLRLQAGRLVQDFQGDGGGRTNSFSVDGNGRLKMEVNVHSPRLPKDVVYRLSFAKKG